MIFILMVVVLSVNVQVVQTDGLGAEPWADGERGGPGSTPSPPSNLHTLAMNNAATHFSSADIMSVDSLATISPHLASYVIHFL